MKLHTAGEDYLEAVLILQKKLGMVRSVDVARYMEVNIGTTGTFPTVEA